MVVEKANLFAFLLSLCSACFANEGDHKPVIGASVPISHAATNEVTCGLDLKPAGASAAFYGRIDAPKGEAIEGEARLFVLGKGKTRIEIEDTRPIRAKPGESISVAFAALPNANAKVTARLDVLDGKGRVLCRTKI